MATESEGTGTPGATATVTPAATETAGEKPKSGEGQHDPAWFNDRIAQAKRSAAADLLKEMGVDSLEVAKSSIAKAKALEDEKKSEIEKANEKAKALEPKAAKADVLEARLTAYGEAELAKLSEEQKAAVLKLTGDDKTRVVEVIDTLRPTWAAAAAATNAAQGAGAANGEKPKLPPPANTSAAGAAPGATKGAPTTDHKAVYEALKKENPMKAAHYAQKYQHAIYK